MKTGIKLFPLPQSPESQLRQIGWEWLLGTDTLPYLASEVVKVPEAEADAYAEAANELFDMLVEAGQHVIDGRLFAKIGIADNLIDLIRHTWDDDRHVLLYGRFDLAKTENGIKLIEFNADTATCLPETAVVQYAHLRANGLDDSRQFNAVFDALVSQFRYIREQNPDLEPTLLLSALRDAPEDDTNVALLGEAAREASFEVAFAYIDEVEFADDGIFRQEPATGQYVRFDYWFKLVPWEYIGEEEPELARILTRLVLDRKVLILNPAYTLLFQSKYILKVLWDLFPNHPLLLRTDVRPLAGQMSVEKVLFGREGANVRVLDASGEVVQKVDGEYGEQAKIYQQYTPFPTDEAGRHYQAGVFFVGGACGLGFRRGGIVLDDRAQFVGHLID